MQQAEYEQFTPSIGVLGCGSLGTAILRGLLSAKEPKVKPKKVDATVGSQASCTALDASLRSLSANIEINVHQGENVNVARDCDVVVLACPPDKMSSIVQEEGMREALSGKVVISVLAGVSSNSIKAAIGNQSTSDHRTWIARALPNLAVARHASATAVEIFDRDFPADMAKVVLAIFEQLGGVVQLPASLMDASTVLCGSTPAWIALFADGLIDGAVAAGVPRSKANDIMAQVLGSTAALLQQGQSASGLRESICAMPGCTIQGNIVLETHGVRGAAAGAMKHAIEAASKLGGEQDQQ